MSLIFMFIFWLIWRFNINLIENDLSCLKRGPPYFRQDTSLLVGEKATGVEGTEIILFEGCLQ